MAKRILKWVGAVFALLLLAALAFSPALTEKNMNATLAHAPEPPPVQAMDLHRTLLVADELPSDATLEDAIERLVFLAKIDRGLAEADAGKLVDHAEVEREFTR